MIHGFGLSDSSQTGQATERSFVPLDLGTDNSGRRVCPRKRFSPRQARMHEHCILMLQGNEGGLILRPSGWLRGPRGILDYASIMPRKLITGVLAVLWLLSPADIIPDAIPALGVIDDAFIVMMAGNPLHQDLLSAKKERRLTSGGEQ